MNQRRRIFFIIFGIYHLMILIFTLYIEATKEDIGKMLDLHGYIWLLPYGAMFGLLLFLTDFIWNWIEHRNAGRVKEVMRHENNTLKAKVYDLQQPATSPVKDSPAGAKS